MVHPVFLRAASGNRTHLLVWHLRGEASITEVRLTALRPEQEELRRKCAQFTETTTSFGSISVTPCGSNHTAGRQIKAGGEERAPDRPKRGESLHNHGGAVRPTWGGQHNKGQWTMSNLAANGATYTSLFIYSLTTRPSHGQVSGKHP